MSNYSGPEKVIFIRHGFTVSNEALESKDRLLYEKLAKTPDHKIWLTDVGKEQARVTGVELREIYGIPKLLLKSGYVRTEETANLILEAYSDEEKEKIVIRRDYGIRERESGYTFGMLIEDVKKEFPKIQEHYEKVGPFFFRPSGGESLAEVSTGRARMFVESMSRLTSGGTVFVVTHGNFTRCCMLNLENWSEDEILSWGGKDPLYNCGIVVYEYSEKEGKFVLREYNKIFWE